MIRVSITDDHPLILNGIRTMIESMSDFVLVGAWSTIAETREELTKIESDILLLDINLPDGDGIIFCREIAKDYPELKIIALTSFNQNIMVKNMIRNGAVGFLLKNTSLEEMRSAMLMVLKGDIFIQEDLKQSLIKESIGKPNYHLKATEVKLTRREKEILKLITEGITSGDISDRLFISIKTVETHRSHLMSKLEANNVAALVRVAVESGLV